MSNKTIWIAVALVGAVAIAVGLYFITPPFSASSVSGHSPLTVTFRTTTGTSPNRSPMNPTWIDFGDGSPTKPLTCWYQIAAYVCWPSIQVTHTYTNPGTYTAKVVQGSWDNVVLQSTNIIIK